MPPVTAAFSAPIQSIICGVSSRVKAFSNFQENQRQGRRQVWNMQLTGCRPRPGFWGGSADLAPSNMTLMKAFGDFQKNQYQERNLRFGVREHGMGAICNGIALHSPGLIPYCATFFIFTGASPALPGDCAL